MSRPKVPKDKPKTKTKLSASVYNSSDAEVDLPVPTASVCASSDVIEAMSGMSLQPCEACQRTEGVQPKHASWFCGECDDLLCDECQAYHKRFKPTANHSVVNTRKSCGMCFKKGKDVVAIRYCEECEELLCTRCMSNHQEFKLLKNHTVVTIQEQLKKNMKTPISFRTENACPEKRISTDKETFATLFTTFDVSCPEDKKNSRITSSAFLPDARLLLTDALNQTIKMFDANFCWIDQRTMEYSPRSIATSDEANIAVAAKASKIIKLSAENELQQTGLIHLDFDCCGVDFINEDTLAITGYDTGLFSIYTVQGVEVMRKIYPFLAIPQCVTIDRKREIAYVSDFSNHGVFAFNLRADCEVIFNYKHRELKTPEQSGLDNHGNIYVGGYASNNIHQISPEGKHMKILLSTESGLDNPWALAFTPQGDRFIVSTGDSDGPSIVRVFSLFQK